MARTLLDFLASAARPEWADRVALVEPKRTFTFAQVLAAAHAYGAAIRSRGLDLGRPVAVFLPKCAEVVFANLGGMLAGAMFSNLDVKSPNRRIKNILDNLDPALVVTSRSLASRLQEAGLEPSRLLLLEDLPEGLPDERLPLPARVDTDPVCIINTSGSTGTPKGVVLHHRGTVDFMDWVFDTLPVDGSERIGSLSPFHFDIYLLELFLCLGRGATLVLIPESHAAFPAALMAFLRDMHISFLFWVPSILVAIANQGLLEEIPLPGLRTVFFAGEVFPTRHFNRWRKALPGVTWVNLYGPIEIHVDCTYFIVDRAFADDEPLPIGFPCRNTDILILDEEGRSCPDGLQGELCVRGSSLAHGYWNDPEKTARAFVQNPLNRAYPETIYRTGDLVWRNPRGEIMFVGRKDYQIKHLGYRIELPEIEHQALQVPGVAQACVLYNQGRKEITLFYEAQDPSVTPARVRAALAEAFPKYMVPTAYHPMDALPRNPNGKIDRSGLAAGLEGPAS
ncbi:amino acid adenylation domain-containing protein [Mesoterricola sediminis]|uniref:Amino acid adenylation protein n=1 Tax=Mesoterricola sediminis TaxID=2927980 RepID=A0AA48KF42_9BACT|nr:amino acid adenylation domain-containing protein [Mesoterricola sediminis]BDU78680.1 amino acid adenylation protein [Mesoterricola sediminis]